MAEDEKSAVDTPADVAEQAFSRPVLLRDRFHLRGRGDPWHHPTHCRIHDWRDHRIQPWPPSAGIRLSRPRSKTHQLNSASFNHRFSQGKIGHRFFLQSTDMMEAGEGHGDNLLRLQTTHRSSSTTTLANSHPYSTPHCVVRRDASFMAIAIVGIDRNTDRKALIPPTKRGRLKLFDLSVWSRILTVRLPYSNA